MTQLNLSWTRLAAASIVRLADDSYTDTIRLLFVYKELAPRLTVITRRPAANLQVYRYTVA